ncbi:MAG: DUF4435 domain-containing protein [Muribaculaceae bacterium]|nr:DUF4435 domain-containing protein [Muribaculaceae bacterium]
MAILLPPDPTGERRTLPAGTRHLTIIGANGAGKTRFTSYLADSLGDNALRLSALKAIYATGEPNDVQATTDRLYIEAARSPSFLTNAAATPFDRLMAMLLNEEISALVEYKMAQTEVMAGRREAVFLPATKLDMVIARWQELFPGNQVLRDGGRLMFAREGQDDRYAQKRLSDGEKALLYYFGAVLYAPKDGVVFVDAPETFLHPSLQQRAWEMIETLRPDCRFIYTTHDLGFTATRNRDILLWVKGYDTASEGWDYTILPRGAGISDEIYMAIIGSRKPLLFIEGDAAHSIDAKLYPLVFRDFTVKSLGSCDKVIESTRAFNDQRSLHNLDSRGIVDRDRRDDGEVAYLRGKNIFVPDVAEIENILMLEEVVRSVATYNGRDENRVFKSVKKSIISMFSHDLRAQAMLHTRHRIKRLMERRVDGKFSNINDFENHLAGLAKELNPRGLYEKLCREFSNYVNHEDYASILKVYNQKSMLPNSNVSTLCGLNGSKEAYVAAIITILRHDSEPSRRMRRAIIRCFGLPSDEIPAV